MNILITGADGFVGKNLITQLSYLKKNISTINKKTSHKDLALKINKADVIFHLAGSNREKNIKNFTKNNVDFTKTVSQLLESSKKKIKIIFASTIHVNQNSIYGKTKKKSEEILKKIKNKKVKVIILRLPNIFGKWSKPYYNSAIATFCYRISRGLKINEHKNKKITLYYIDDLILYLLKLIIKNPSSMVIKKFPNLKNTNLKFIIKNLNYFYQLNNNEIPENISDDFIKKLFSTFIYFSPKSKLNTILKTNTDLRGEFVELVKSKKIGQFSILKINPKKERGDHFHNTKIEYFFVLSGIVKFYYKNLFNNEKNSFIIKDSNIKRVTTIPGVLHKIKNLGSRVALLAIWTNELHDVNKPDTYKLR